MEPNKILSASFLDLLFDHRNKEYGAYDLRKTYPRRVKKALIITGTVALLAFAGVALGNSLKPREEARILIDEVTIADLKNEKPPEPLPQPKKPEQIPTRSVQFTTPVIVKDLPEPPPTQTDLHDTRIDIKTEDGPPDTGIPDIKDIDKDKGIIDAKNTDDDVPRSIVEIDAKFTGNWEKFLIKNLNPGVPADNDAPAGRYTVLMQFVVDLEGNVSDIKPLTNIGYGLEQEAVRVLKKAVKWEPAIQNGRHVKAYRRQPITFVVEGTQ